MKLEHGDVFAVKTNSFWSKAINAVCRWNSSDGKSKYNHAGLLVSVSGITFESLKVISYHHLNDYIGCELVIARSNADPKAKYNALISVTKQHSGKRYPWWRIPLHIYPPLARKLSFARIPTCSELVAENLYLTESRHGQFYGATPDMLSDEWHQWRNFEIIFEGVWKGTTETS